MDTFAGAMHTNEEQVEANGELAILGDNRVERGCRGCLPDFVQRHECGGIDVTR